MSGAIDFGPPVSGAPGLTANGTTLATATVLRKRVNVFTTVAVNGCAALPSSYAPGSLITVLNRGANELSVLPAEGDQIEGYGVDQAVGVAAPGSANFVSFDPPLSPSPRTWWLI